MIKILVIYTDTHGGVGYYRSYSPHKFLNDNYHDEIDVTFDTNPQFKDLSKYNGYDIIHIHKGLYENHDDFKKFLQYCRDNKIVTVLDLDDYWQLPQTHGKYISAKLNDEPSKILFNIKNCDYVTTTTQIFANEIKKHNKNVVVLPNSIDNANKITKFNKKENDKLRIGIITGSTHSKDISLLDNFVSMLSPEIREQIIFVLCGFDTRGFKTIYQSNGEVIRKPIEPEESVWCQYEKEITCNYKWLSDRYKMFLKQYVPDSVYSYDDIEGYKRCWTKDINTYLTHYNECDVTLVPLFENDFNKYKSQLKAIECAFTNTAFIGSNFGPYTIDLINIFDKGGNINENGNAILIENRKGGKAWAKAIEKLVKNRELVTKLQNNITRDLSEKYNLQTTSKERLEFYKKIVKK